ncbi:NAD+ synthase [Flaviaesturariibacter flavus]|uniref:Glutamine-dependent NAD(+) synthetase n=1 Tax=Flaviaesturariibacter flavus TaxID=2502780 RepID=A0A4V2NVQ0_9BACT|nr:NAD+ synthase [Flaviaesturariibacter flavus]TCJ14282.1 NAD+ synthase [Flaviaesturariibacter flavus]
MKIFLAQQNYHIGNFEANVARILDGIDRGRAAGAELVVFSELCICGYPPRDFLDFADFIRECYAALDRIKAHAPEIGVLVGAPARNPQKEGKELFNASYLLYGGEVKAEIHKTLLPTYDVFDENRYFEPAFRWRCVDFKGKKLAVTICEDIWNLGDNPLYRVTPMEHLIKEGPDVMINLSASPYNYAADTVRRSIVEAHTAKYGIPMLYCNTVGAQTEIVFDGGSLVYDINAQLVKEMAYFREDYALFDLEELTRKKEVPAADHKYYYSATQVGRDTDTLVYLTDDKNIQEIHDALILGIRDYFGKMGFGKATLGASGGIDSAVVQALAVEALGKDAVHVLLLPSPYSSDHSVDDAVKLSENLGNRHDIVHIEKVYNALLETLKPLFGDLPFNIAEENLQSRTRGNLLMGLANKFGYILLNTSNKSELATGYGTLYGDMAGGLGVLGDLYKMQVYALARYINREREIIPNNILVKAPSAELRPGQKDSDSLPDYEVLDRILYQYIELSQGPQEIVAQGYDEALVTRILRMVNRNEYKRNQFCPIIRVSSKAFGVGRRLPIVAKYLG